MPFEIDWVSNLMIVHAEVSPRGFFKDLTGTIKQTRYKCKVQPCFAVVQLLQLEGVVNGAVKSRVGE